MNEPKPLLLSHLDRRLIADGTLARWIHEGRIAGAITDRSRFAHAIASDPAYESGFRRLMARGDDAAGIAEGLIREDLHAALDLFRPLYDGSDGRFGYVSLGVSPGAERDPKRALHEAERLRHLIDRPNVLIAIPAGPGIWSAIEEALTQGTNVEVSHITNLRTFENCLNTYFRVVRKRAAGGVPLGRLAMIAQLDPSVGEEEAARILGHASERVESADWREFAALGGRFPQLALIKAPQGELPDGIAALKVVTAGSLENPGSSWAARFSEQASAEEAMAEVEESFATWMHLIESKRERLEQEATTPGQTGRLGPSEQAIHDALDDLEHRGAVRSLWKEGSPAAGWLDAVKSSRPPLDELTTLADEIAEAEYAHVLLIGRSDVVAGAEVLRRTHIPMWGHPELLVLDRVVPATVRRIASAIDPKSTLVVVAECGGEVVETEALYAYFSALFRAQLGDDAGSRFIAVTDPGSALETEAEAAGFRRIFRNPPGIPPADSALSLPGLVPAALMGLDVATLLGRAEGAIDGTRPWTPIEQNPSATLGAALAGLAQAGRNVLTLICPAPIEAFGMMIEPLVASRNLGILPIVGEPLGSPAMYGNDRLFVQIRTVDGRNTGVESALDALADAGHPVITHILADPLDLGAEYFRWQVATALAETMLGRKTEEDSGSIPTLLSLVSDGGLTLWTDPANAVEIRRAGTSDRERFVATLSAHFARIRPGDCVAVVPYFDEREVRDVTLEMIRTTLRDVLRVATIAEYGSRYRNGAGKVGERDPGSVLLLQLKADEGDDVPLPDQPLTLGALDAALALRDFPRDGGRALRIDLGKEVDRALGTLRERLGEALAMRGAQV